MFTLDSVCAVKEEGREATKVYVMHIDPRQGRLAEEALQLALVQTVAYHLVSTTGTLAV
mgnify:FL=1